MSEPAETTTGTPLLLPCPFCRGDAYMTSVLRDGYENYRDDPDARAYFPRCRCCAAHGPWKKSPTGAARLWNTRSDPPGESPESVRLQLRECEEQARESERERIEEQAMDAGRARLEREVVDASCALAVIERRCGEGVTFEDFTERRKLKNTLAWAIDALLAHAEKEQR